MPLVLLIADGPGASDLQRRLETADDRTRALRCTTLSAALRLLRREQVDCVVTELVLPDVQGELVLQAIRRVGPRLPVVVVTAHGSEEYAIMAFKAGAVDYLRRDEQCGDVLPRAIREAIGRSHVLRADDEAPSCAVEPPSRSMDEGLVFATPDSQALLATVERAACSSVAVLIEGETGTGKDVLARLVHRSSPRRTAPFVAQNCAALPDTLLETELFGHQRGAFTGADRDRRGLFVEAGDGTVFLDEIGDAPLAVQAKLLRVLQHGEVKALGTDRPVRIRARFIAATNRRLDDEVAAGRFREDLYYRLAVFPIRIPPLRHRVGEIPLLAKHFLGRHQAEERRELDGLAQSALDALRAYPWPGNVRELEHEMHRLVLTLPQGRRIHRHDLAPRIQRSGGVPAGEPLRAIVRDVELAVIRQRLREHPSKASAARSLGLTREALHEKLRRLEAGGRR